jgi:lipopolysaccharide export system permease protein
MSAITRYIFAEFLKNLFAATSVVALFIWVFLVGERLQTAGLSVELAFSLMPYLIPYAVKSALQAGILFAACIVYGRLASTNELTALKSMGVSPILVVLPALAIGLVLSVAAPALDDFHSSWCCRRVLNAVHHHADVVCLTKLRNEGVLTLKDFALRADRVEGNRLYGVHLNIGEAGKTVSSVQAAEGNITRGHDGADWLITLKNGAIETENYQLTFSEPLSFHLPLKPGTAEAFDYSKIKAQQEVVVGLYDQWRTTRDPEDAALLSLRYDKELGFLRRYKTQFMHKWANGFSSVGFVMIAAPVAMIMKSSGYLSSFFACFLPVLLIYQPLHKIPTIYAEAGTIPAFCVWLPNILLMIVGGLLLRFVSRN